MQHAVVVPQRAVDVRIGQGQPGEGFADVTHLGLRAAQKLPPHRRVVEQLSNFDRRPPRAAARRHAQRMTGRDFQLGTGRRLVGAAAQDQPADFGDRRQGFAPKSERRHAKQIVAVAQFARGMAGHGQRQFVGGNSAAVVGHAHQFQPTLLDRHVDPPGAGIDRVFHQLFDDARRPLDHLAGGDLVHDARR